MCIFQSCNFSYSDDYVLLTARLMLVNDISCVFLDLFIILVTCFTARSLVVPFRYGAPGPKAKHIAVRCRHRVADLSAWELRQFRLL
jgi:hypothetical protein